ncbi:MAG: right-handed parallel beta-helix repeat-containing protein, partial [Gemmataceae bacterium]|nr:right-handed parallel beta-helix repeat-containing protein [Gemmataceae bacterium]
MFRTRSKSRVSRRPLFGRQRLWLQCLEDRQVPAIFTVTTNADAGAGSLREALTLAQNNAQDDTITFNTGLVTSPISVTGGELSYVAPSTEGKSLTITWPGAGKLTLQSSGAASTTRRVFNFSDASTTVPSVAISLSNLVITGGNLSSGNGAGILTTNESLSLTNCDVTANTTAGAGAGLAASAATPTITLSGTVFSNNSATSTGGAINVGAAAKLDILASSSFTGNRSGGTGGAIHSASTLTLNITNATVSGNSAASTGGAIHTASAATVTINTSTFSSNTSASSGGAINTASTVSFTASDSTFNSNFANTGAGAIRFASSTSTVTLNRCTVSGNTASTSHGGGIYMFSGGSLTANESTFSGNAAGLNGGGIASFTATVTLTNCTISGNEARSTAANAGGGGISLNSSANLIVNNSTIANNKATAVSGVGGGIRKSSATGTITLNSTIVAGNTAPGGGPDINHTSTIALTTILGGDNLIGVDDSGNFALSGTNKTGNLATPLNAYLAPLGNYGGPTLTHGFRYISLAKDNGNNLAAKSFDQRGTPFNRVVGAKADVGAVEGELTVPFVESATGLTDVNGPGGTAYAFTVTFNDETGVDTSKLGTGEVTVTGPAGFFNVVPTFKGFTTSGKQVNASYEFVPPGGSWDTVDGGTYSVNLVAGKLFDTDVPTPQSAPATLIGTFNVGMAGALVVDNGADVDDGNVSAGNVTLREAIRISNASVGGPDTITFSGLNGTTITLVSGELSITDGVIINGPGAANLTISGAVAVSATNRIFNINVPGIGGDIKISGLTFAGGNVTGSGGAITLADETADFTNVSFSGNKASSNGGAINTTTNASVTLTGCTFTNNTATSSGGAVAIGAGTNLLTVTNSTFTGNSAGVQGGAIQGGSTITLTVSGSTFTSNTATTGGGAINVGVGMHSISNSTFSKNNGGGASGVGGALNLPSANTVVGISNSTFSNNTAGSAGGAINGVSTLTLNIDDSKFTGNFATATGGAIRVARAATTVTMNNTTVSGNTGTGGGGIYFLAGGSLTVNNSTIDTNVASTAGGGGMRLGAATVAITNSTISGNNAVTGGAGIRLAVVGASLTLANTTVTNNSTGGKGGGVYFIGNTNTVQFDSTIVSGNFGATNRDLSGSVATQSIAGTKNLIGAYDPSIVTIDTLNNLSGTEAAPLDAKLAPLNNFGGPTRTHGLFSGSPAVDMGSNVNGLGTDQRGPGFTRVVGANPDVGAFEGELKIPSASTTLANVNTAGGTVYSAKVVYTDETAINTGSIDLNDVTLTGGVLGSPLSPSKVSFTGSGVSVTATYEFTPPGGSWDFFDGGVYTLNMIANQVFDTDGPSSVLAGPLGSFTVSIPQTLVVDNVLDEDDTDYSAGDFSLREALRLANTASPGGIDTITFAPALSGSTIFLLTGQIAITDGVVIQGPGSGSLSIAGAATASATNRLFNINIAAAGAKVDISGLTLKSGNVTGTGGAITMVDELLTLNDVTLSGNKASSTGGAISVSTATTITLTNSTFSGNSSGSTGGGISMPATTGASSTTVSGSTFINNTAASSGGAINGGSTVTFTTSN